MRKTAIGGIALVVTLLAGAGGWAQSQATMPWLHLRVTDAGDESADVNLNLPLAAVRVAADLLVDRIMPDGRVGIGPGGEISIEDARELWTALREAGEAEFVSVSSVDANIQVARRGDMIHVEVDRRRDSPRTVADAGPRRGRMRNRPRETSAAEDDSARQQRVRIDVPVAVVDALLSGDGPTPNLGAAIAELEQLRGDIVRIEDGENRQVHVWIDERE